MVAETAEFLYSLGKHDINEINVVNYLVYDHQLNNICCYLDIARIVVA